MACLKESTIQGYLEELAPDPLNRIVESHLSTCARCRTIFDRVVATNRRVNAWLSKLASPADALAIDATTALRQIDHIASPFTFGSALTHRPNPQAFTLSFIFQGAIVALLMLAGTTRVIERANHPTVTLIAPPPPLKTAQPKAGHMGGGAHSPRPPAPSPQPKLAPKVIVMHLTPLEHSAPFMDPSLLAPTDAWAAPTGTFGDALASFGGPGGRGTDDGPGSGNRKGPGSGDDLTLATPGNGVSKPELLSHADPEYSEEARKAKYSGSVWLSIVVNTDGTPASIKVVKSLGMGLDERAIEAVQKWRFKPAMRNGTPVPVRAQVEVNFRLL